MGLFEKGPGPEIPRSKQLGSRPNIEGMRQGLEKNNYDCGNETWKY